jgi:DNA-binding transcriptional LysR family regulator
MAFDGRLLGGISVLAAVVETGNFVRAADALGLTQSGISRAVARLEARVGVRLLDRTPRAVSLTDEGRRFHTQVAPLLAGLEEAASEAAEASHAVRGRLKVNVDPWFARLVLAPRLSGLLGAHPQLSIELVVRDTLGDLVSEGFDVAVRFGEPEPSALIARKLLDTRILTCAAPAYLARCGQPRHPRDLERHECLLFRDPVTGRPFAWEFHRAGKGTRFPRFCGRQHPADLEEKTGNSSRQIRDSRHQVIWPREVCSGSFATGSAETTSPPMSAFHPMPTVNSRLWGL